MGSDREPGWREVGGRARRLLWLGGIILVASLVTLVTKVWLGSPRTVASGPRETVPLDVSVVGLDGDPVAGLQSEHFSVTENGAVCPVVFVTEVSRPSTQRGDRVPRQRRVFVLFVDDLSFTGREWASAAVAVQRFIEGVLEEGDQLALVSSGPSALAVDLTAAHATVLASLRTAAERDEARQTFGEVVGGAQPSSISIQTLAGVFEGLRALKDTRKILLLLHGDPSSPASGTPGQGDVDRAVDETVHQLAATANAAAVVVFSLRVGAEQASERPSRGKTDLCRENSSSRLEGVFSKLAMLTGGLSWNCDHSLDEVVTALSRSSRHYYVVGYTSDRPPGDAGLRRLEVAVKTPGVTVHSRQVLPAVTRHTGNLSP